MDQHKRRRASPGELRERVSKVEEWFLIEELPYGETVRRAVEKWGCSERTAKRYIRAARNAVEEEKHEAWRKRLMRRVIPAGLTK